jgi:hypothetical protein
VADLVLVAPGICICPFQPLGKPWPKDGADVRTVKRECSPRFGCEKEINS